MRSIGGLRVSVAFVLLMFQTLQADAAESVSALQIGLAEADITPPIGFPMAGYFHERLAEGQIDPLKAKAIVFRSESQSAALVVCDLTAVSADLSEVVRAEASQRTGIPADHITVAATHSHTAPDYTRALYDYLSSDDEAPVETRGESAAPDAGTSAESAPGGATPAERRAYMERLIETIVQTIVRASEDVQPSQLSSGWAEQTVPVAFNRRFVQRDGSVRTWVGLDAPNSVRSAGPIDPEIGLLQISDSTGQVRGVLSSFALHLDTVGGLRWSADYPYFIEQSLKEALGPNVISVFGTGCCGDINHVNPRGQQRNKTDFIGGSLGETIRAALPQLEPLSDADLQVRAAEVLLPLREITPDDVSNAVRTMQAVRSGETVEFLDHVAAHRTLLIDQMRNQPPIAAEHGSLARRQTHCRAGIGDALPVDIQVICPGQDLAIVCLPGEVFVDLGLAIKRGSPFRTTIIVELSNSIECCYVPTRAACAGGSYEVTNSTVMPGAGEILVEESLKLLRSAAGAMEQSSAAGQ